MSQISTPARLDNRDPAYRASGIPTLGSVTVHSILVMTVLLMSSRALGALVFSDDAGGGSNQFELVLWVGIYGACFLTLINYPPNFKMDIAGFATFLIVGLALSSVLWSDSAATSLKRATALGGSWIVGLYLARTVSLESMFKFIQILCFVAVTASIVVAVLLPNLGVTQQDFYTEVTYGWNGSLPQKNWLGRLAALSLAIWLISLLSNRRYAIGKLFLATMSLVLMMKSESATSLILGLALIGTIGFVVAIRTQKEIAILATMTAVVTLVAFVMLFFRQPESFYSLVGRSSTLTGRSNVWEAVDSAIKQKPLLGYGYGGFWLSEGGPQELVWDTLWGYRPTAAHNGFKEIRLDLGYVGLALIGFVLANGTVRALLLSRHRRDATCMLIPVFFIFTLVANITESYLVLHNSLIWILLVYFTFQLGHKMKELPTNEAGIPT